MPRRSTPKAKQQSRDTDVNFPRSITKNGSRINPDGSNIGGRVMILQEKLGHHKRMASVASTIDTKQPWGFNKKAPTTVNNSGKSRSKSSRSKRAHTSHGGRSSKKKSLNALRSPKNRSNSSIGVPRGAHRTAPMMMTSPLTSSQHFQNSSMSLLDNGVASGAINTRTKVVDPFFDLEPHQREIYEQFVTMLAQLGNSEKCRILAHNAARDAEERYLLSDYTDVSNYFDAMLTKPAAEPPTAMGGASSHHEQSYTNHYNSSMSQSQPLRSPTSSRLSEASLARPSSRQMSRSGSRARYGSGNYIPADQLDDFNGSETGSKERREDEEVDVFGNPLTRKQPAGNDLKRDSIMTANTDEALDFHLDSEGNDDDLEDNQSFDINDEDLLESAPPDYDDLI